MDASVQQPAEIARRCFGQTDLGDRRRTQRLVNSVQRILEHPEGSLPQKLGTPAALDGFYRLMDSSSVTHERLIAEAGRQTAARMREHGGVMLIIHDTTVLDYSGLDSIEDLGQVGDGHGRGFYAHNSLAVTSEKRVLGLAHQILHVRRDVPPRETKAQRQQALDRESRLWKRACAALPVAPEHQCWVDVADRGADVTEFLAFEHECGRSYVVRSQHNRCVETLENKGEMVETKLHDHARSLTPACSMRRTIKVPARTTRPARTAELDVAWTKLSIIPPRQPRGEHGPERLEVWAVRVWEVKPPKKGEAIEWLLLTNVAVNDEASAWERVDWYSARWVVEEYHKCLKTGLSIEQMQFTSRDRLAPAIALYSVIGAWILELRDASRCAKRSAQPATQFVPELWIRILSTWRHDSPRLDWTVGEFLYALARLGGHQNRRHDHPPGWLILWRGWKKLQLMLAGARAYAGSKCGET